MKIKNVAIIGAGWTGMQIAKVLMDCGYKVTIFEELSDVGGTWSPELAYYELSVHTALYLCEFYNFRFPDTHNRNKKLFWRDIYEYCRDFAKDNNLYERMHLNTTVIKLNYITDQQKCIATIRGEDRCEKDLEFDFVISTFFNSPRMPQFPGHDKFAGKIYHSSDVNEEVFNEICKNNSKVVLLGGNKSATDMALVFLRYNYNFKWVLRQMYWFLSYDKIFWCLRRDKRASWLNKTIYLVFRIITSAFKKYDFVHQIMMSLMYILGFLKCPGRKHFNFKKCHLGWLDSTQYTLANAADNKIYTEIESLNEDSLNLSNGTIVACDVLICATGCDTFSKKIDLCRDGKSVEISKGDDALYRYSIVPELPLFYFTGITQVSPYGPMNGYNRSAAIMRYMDIVANEGVPNFTQLLAKEPQNFTSLKNNILFDTNAYVIAEFQERAERVMFDLLTTKDGMTTIVNALYKMESTPYPTAHNYILSKIKNPV